MNFDTKKAQYYLTDLDIFDVTPIREFDALVGLCHSAINANMILVFANEVSQRLFVRSAINVPRGIVLRDELPLAQSRTEGIILGNRSRVVDDISREPIEMSGYCEVSELRQRSFCASPIHDPKGSAVGVLYATHNKPHRWTPSEREAVAQSAYLLSLQVLLRASLETIRLKASDLRPRVN